MENNDQSQIEKVESKLYSRRYRPKDKSRGMMSSVDTDLPRSWDSLEKSEEMKQSNTKKLIKPSFYKKLFYTSVTFFVVAVGFAVVNSFFGGASISSDRIDINIIGNTFAEGGETLPLTVEVVNRNRGTLELVDLAVEYPKGSSPDSEKVRFRTSLGDIGAGSRKEEDIEVVLFGEQNGVQNIIFNLEYRISGSNSTFEKEVVYPVTIARSPISINVEAPTDIAPNQDIELEVIIKQDASQDSTPLGVSVEYPIGFKYEEAIPSPILGDNVFSLGEIPAGSEKSIIIKGKMFGEEGEERSFRVYAGEFSATNATEIGTVLSSYIHTILLRKPFLEATLVYAGGSGDTFVVTGGEEVKAEIRWANNLPERIDNAEIVLDFSGSAFDSESVESTRGFYKTESNELIFSKTTVPDFASIAPGENGTLTFSFVPKSTGTGGGMIQSGDVRVGVSISGISATLDAGQNTVSTIEEKIFKVASLMKVSGRVLYHTGNLDNTGPLPPTPGSSTTYTVVWSITNSSNVLSDGTVKATLPLYVDWVGDTFPPNENISFNPTTREVVWRMGTVAPSVGYNSPVREASFRVRLNASGSQSGTSPVIIEQTLAEARDEYTGIFLQSNWTGLTTKLFSDPESISTEWVVAN